MQTISFKLDDSIVKEIDRCLKPMRYSNRTEFIREAVREKLSSAEKEQAIVNLKKYFGAGRKPGQPQTTDEELEKIRDKVFRETARKHRIRLD